MPSAAAGNVDGLALSTSPSPPPLLEKAAAFGAPPISGYICESAEQCASVMIEPFL